MPAVNWSDVPVSILRVDEIGAFRNGSLARALDFPADYMFVGRVGDQRVSLDWRDAGNGQPAFFVSTLADDERVVCGFSELNFNVDLAAARRWNDLTHRNGVLCLANGAPSIVGHKWGGRDPLRVIVGEASQTNDLSEKLCFTSWTAYVMIGDKRLVLWKHGDTA